MKYEIFGGAMPAVTISLEEGEAVFTQSGAMSWMTPEIRMETSMSGGLFKGIGRMFSGESLFMASFTAEAVNQSITMASSYPGTILPISISDGKSYICQKSSFLAAEQTIELNTYIPPGVKAGLFGGEGFILQKISGKGIAFLEIDGTCKEIDLKKGESLVVDTGNVAIFESSVTYTAKMVKGFKNILFGGEGLFVTTLTGPGKIWLQTMPLKSLAERIIPFVPSGK